MVDRMSKSKQHMAPYLESSDFIDWLAPSVNDKALELAEGKISDDAIAKACFEFVRDEIKHSWDDRMNPVTSKASDVLTHGTGYCYAKSHLLAALLRANHIPTALCYQRLKMTDDRPLFCLHGLNAVYLKKYGWIRMDARGNKEGIMTEFNPPEESLAFQIRTEGEMDIEEYFSKPLDRVIEVLGNCLNFEEVDECLPDMALGSCRDNH